MRRPNKPHVDGYEDEEDCEGYYDPDEADRRRCHPSWASRGRLPTDPCEICCQAWRTQEAARLQAERDARTPEEQARLDSHLAELRKLY